MPSENLKISDYGEKKLINRLLGKTRKHPFKSLFFDELSYKSRSDDAAIFNFGENYIVLTTDLLTESSHFPDEMTPRQIGKKVVTVNVSDIAAMGADSLGIVIAMSLPEDLSIHNFDEILEGILEACEYYEMPLIGGDINQSSELVLCGTCLGIVDKNRVMMKSGARVGDVIAVTGPLGVAAAGFEILFDDELKLKNLNPDFKEYALKHALEPNAQLNKGILFAETGFVTSATDITDGLLSELGELIQNNDERIGIMIYEDELPIPDEIFKIAKYVNRNPLEIALSYGEDFEILLTIEKEKFNELKEKILVHKIGYVTLTGQIQMINKEGKTEILTPHGYEHFKN